MNVSPRSAEDRYPPITVPARLDAFDHVHGVMFDLENEDCESCDEDTSPRIRCSACGHPLTRANAAQAIDGREQHRATNPAGIRYAFRTFSAAPGCRPVGEACETHSWFPPHRWRVADCGGCGMHCGWFFDRVGGDRFVALIEGRFIEDTSP